MVIHTFMRYLITVVAVNFFLGCIKLLGNILYYLEQKVIMSEKKVMTKLEKMSIEEKLKLLSETDKAFIHGYVERAFIEQQRTKAVKKNVRVKSDRTKETKGED